MSLSAWPAEPSPTHVRFPPVEDADEHGRVMFGGDLQPGTLLHAYRSGLFPMRSGGRLAWWSPDPRAVLLVELLRVSRSLRKSARRFYTTVDKAFEAVMAACADRPPDEVWITDDFVCAYVRLHELGWAHSVETWFQGPQDVEPALVGGLYGVAIGGLFAGESMFSRRSDASKVALLRLVELLRGSGADGGDRLIDVQWQTPHLASLGAIEITRTDYLARLARAVEMPLPAFGDVATRLMPENE